VPHSHSRTRARHKILPAIAVVGGLSLLAGVVFAVMGGRHHAAPGAVASRPAAEPAFTPLAAGPSSAPRSARTASSPAPGATRAAGQAAQLAVVPHTVTTYTGSGIETTPSFTTTASWQLGYSFNCTQFGAPARAEITEGPGADTILVNEKTLTAKGRVQVSGQAGSHYLKVNTACSWTVKVVDQP
jgi:hypothetical protein